MASPFEVLGLPENSPLSEVKSAYRKLAKKYHPDVNKDPGAEEKFKEVSKAYEDIIDPKPENNPQQNWNPFNGFNDHDFFNNFRRNANLNTPVNIRLFLNLEDCFQDCIKTVFYERTVGCNICKGQGGTNPSVCHSCMGSGQHKQTIQQGPFFFEQILGPCQNCKGTGKKFVEICKKCNGSSTIQKKESFDLRVLKGQVLKTITLIEKGNQIDVNSPPGPLMIEVLINPKENFEFSLNGDLLYNKEIDPVAALVGCQFVFDHPSGSKVKYNLKSNVKNGQMHKTQNKGLPIDDKNFGDLYIRFMYKNPENISEEEMDSLKKYLDSRKERNLLWQ